MKPLLHQSRHMAAQSRGDFSPWRSRHPLPIVTPARSRGKVRRGGRKVRAVRFALLILNLAIWAIIARYL